MVNGCLETEAIYGGDALDGEGDVEIPGEEEESEKDVVTLNLRLLPGRDCLQKMLDINVTGECFANNRNGNASSTFKLRFSNNYMDLSNQTLGN